MLVARLAFLRMGEINFRHVHHAYKKLEKVVDGVLNRTPGIKGLQKAVLPEANVKENFWMENMRKKCKGTTT